MPKYKNFSVPSVNLYNFSLSSDEIEHNLYNFELTFCQKRKTPAYFLPKYKIWVYPLAKRKTLYNSGILSAKKEKHYTILGLSSGEKKNIIQFWLIFCQKIKSHLHLLPKNKISNLSSGEKKIIIHNFDLSFGKMKNPISTFCQKIKSQIYPLAK